MKDDYSRQPTETPAEKMHYYADIMRHIVAFYKLITLPPCTQVWDKVVTKIYVVLENSE